MIVPDSPLAVAEFKKSDGVPRFGEQTLSDLGEQARHGGVSMPALVKKDLAPGLWRVFNVSGGRRGMGYKRL